MISIRHATIADSSNLLTWRNDPVTRASSLSVEPVSPAQHDAWFTRALSDPTRTIYIGQVDGEDAGMCRFDRDNGVAEVSVNISPAFRGRRLGQPILKAAIDDYRASTPQAHELLARINRSNRASIALFLDLGFVKTEEDREFGLYRLRLPAGVS